MALIALPTIFALLIWQGATSMVASMMTLLALPTYFCVRLAFDLVAYFRDPEGTKARIEKHLSKKKDPPK